MGLNDAIAPTAEQAEFTTNAILTSISHTTAKPAFIWTSQQMGQTLATPKL